VISGGEVFIGGREEGRHQILGHKTIPSNEEKKGGREEGRSDGMFNREGKGDRKGKG